MGNIGKGLLIIAVATLMGSCVEISDETLSIFFDGVKPEIIAGKARKKARPVVTHPPFVEGSCSDCHNTSKKSMMDMPVPALCYDCHDEEKFTKETVHSPVEDGECIECHDPHKSAYKRLLKKPVVQTCFNCHEEEEDEDLHPTDYENLLSEGPLAEDEERCIKCHNPHSENAEFMLKKANLKAVRAGKPLPEKPAEGEEDEEDGDEEDGDEEGGDEEGGDEEGGDEEGGDEEGGDEEEDEE